MCLLLDALYLNQTVLGLAQQHNLHYLISFKEGSAPDAYHEFQVLATMAPAQALHVQQRRTEQHYRWVEQLQLGDSTFNAIECVETDSAGKTTRFLWTTNYRPTATNVQELSHGGRCRWKIENQGFNTQKHGGYALEHPYCEDWTAAQNFYFLMQIAHLIAQLIQKGSLLTAPPAKLFGSLRAFALRLLEAWRIETPDPADFHAQMAGPFQIRLDSS
jgi:hypothetical protein